MSNVKCQNFNVKLNLEQRKPEQVRLAQPRLQRRGVRGLHQDVALEAVREDKVFGSWTVPQ